MNYQQILAMLGFVLLALVVSPQLQAAEIRVGITSDVLTMDPADFRDRETETVLRNIYDGLITRDNAMHLHGELVRTWKREDFQSYLFRIKTGVKFHDGSLMTAEDIRFTFQRMIDADGLNGRSSPRKSLLGPLDAVEIVDEHTLRFRFSAPHPIFPAMLPFQMVVSKKYVTGANPEALETQAIGTGPFKLKKWTRGKSIILERFDGYYGGSTNIPPVGAACVERVTFYVIPSPRDRLQMLLTGKLEIATDLPHEAQASLRNNRHAMVAPIHGTRSFFVALNNSQAPFNNPLVRRAANHALDRRTLINKLLVGNARPINGVLSPSAFGFNPELPSYDHNPARARALLKQAGYRQEKPLSFEISKGEEMIGRAIAKMLTTAGMTTRVVVREATELKKIWRNRQKSRGHMWLTSWGNGSLDPTGIFEPTLGTNGRGNSAGYSNPEVDRLLASASTEENRGKRAALYQSAEKIVQQDAPWIFLWIPQEIYGVSRRVKGWRPRPDGRINLHDACLE